MKRLFLAIHINPGEEFLDAFHVIKEQMAEEKIKWVEEENFHLTLKYIGEVADDRVGKITNQLKTVKTDEENTFTIEGIGLIRNLSVPKTIYAKVKKTEEIELLTERIDLSLSELGIAADAKKFLPHITLGRIKYLNCKGLMKSLLDDFCNTYFQEERCKEFILFESILTPKGPIYKRIASFPF